MYSIRSFFTPELARSAPPMRKPRAGILRPASSQIESYLPICNWLTRDHTAPVDDQLLLPNDLAHIAHLRNEIITDLSNPEALLRSTREDFYTKIHYTSLFSPKEEQELERILYANHGAASAYKVWHTSAMSAYARVSTLSGNARQSLPHTAYLLTFFSRETVGKILALAALRQGSERPVAEPTVESALYTEILSKVVKKWILARYAQILPLGNTTLYTETVAVRKRLYQESKFSEFLALYPHHMRKLFLENLTTDIHARSQSTYPAPLYGTLAQYDQVLDALQGDIRTFEWFLSSTTTRAA